MRARLRHGRAAPNDLDVGRRLSEIQRRLEDIAAASAEHGAKLDALGEILQMLHDEEARNRVRLHELRRTADYEAAFTEPEPLVTVSIPVYDRAHTLLARSIPSALAQTYEQLEVLVVGDASPPEVEQAVRSFGDPRVRYHRLPINGPYPEDPHRAWLSSGSAPYNAAVSEARGRWIAPLADDDEFTPDHVEVLLATAREQRLELAYGLIRSIEPDGPDRIAGEFPPRATLTEMQAPIALQASIMHGGLCFMQMQLTDALYDLPNDFALTRRMVRIGVRMGMIDRVVTDYFPSLLWREH